MEETLDSIAQKVENLFGETLKLRRDFHRHPELGLQEHRTGQIVADYLTNCGLEVSRSNVTGVVGLLRGAFPGPTLLMRADMDALPIQEETGASYKSTIDGVMHACGHDAHTAMLLVAAKILSGEQQQLHGNIKFVFEPNEENIGALAMIEEGVLENPRVDSCIGVHVWSPLASGKVGIKAGAVMAGMQHFKLELYGKGGHTATPQSAVDPILASAAIIQGVQAIQTRELDVLQEPAVIMFGSIVGGSAANVIPSQVTLQGTIRYLSEGGDEGEGSPLVRFRRVVDGICAAHRIGYDLEYSFGHPTLVNDGSMTKMLAGQVLCSLRNSLEIEPLVTLAGEDFSEFASRVPGVFYFLGAGKPGTETYPHHHPCFDIDESVMQNGVEIHVRAALQFFENQQKDSSKML